MDYPPFAEAVARLRCFLNDQGHRGAIGWIFPSDALLVGGRWALRPRPQDAVVEEVAVAYRAASTRRLGVKFGVLCKVSDGVWCYVYQPADRIEAEHCLMPDGLKLSVGTPPDEARIVVDEWEWERLRARDQSEFKRWRFM
jgi:hypothetical protein